MTFGEALRIQRWDDHRYYHHSRINQSLHLVSALSFIAAYATMWTSPSLAVALGWLVAMPARQAGHFFFEPRGYDEANQATHEHKEAIKVGYNLFRKVVLMAVWVLAPLVLLVSPTVWGWVPAGEGWRGVADQVAIIWLAVAVGALLFRIAQLFVIANVQTGLVWGTKILTDPFHDVALYHRAPLYVLRGERFDPIVPHSAR
jgi:hypothetical protein